MLYEVITHGPCIPASLCPDDEWFQRFEYEWDEVGRLVRARRFDAQNPSTIPPTAQVEMEYAYDASDSP